MKKKVIKEEKKEKHNLTSLKSYYKIKNMTVEEKEEKQLKKLFKKLFQKVGKKDIKTCCMLIIIEKKYRTKILNSFKKKKVNIYEMITGETSKLLI